MASSQSAGGANQITHRGCAVSQSVLQWDAVPIMNWFYGKLCHPFCCLANIYSVHQLSLLLLLLHPPLLLSGIPSYTCRPASSTSCRSACYATSANPWQRGQHWQCSQWQQYQQQQQQWKQGCQCCGSSPEVYIYVLFGADWVGAVQGMLDDCGCQTWQLFCIVQYSAFDSAWFVGRCSNRSQVLSVLSRPNTTSLASSSH